VVRRGTEGARREERESAKAEKQRERERERESAKAEKQRERDRVRAPRRRLLSAFYLCILFVSSSTTITITLSTGGLLCNGFSSSTSCPLCLRTFSQSYAASSESLLRKLSLAGIYVAMSTNVLVNAYYESFLWLVSMSQRLSMRSYATFLRLVDYDAVLRDVSTVLCL
jgi:hypothetical protein